MPAWASDPLPWLWKGALWGAFLAFATPSLAEIDLNGLWQDPTRDGTPCQATAETFTDQDGVLTMTLPQGDAIWPPVDTMSWNHGAWKDGRLELVPAGPLEPPLWAEEKLGGLNFCRKEGGINRCAHYRRCEPKS